MQFSILPDIMHLTGLISGNAFKGEICQMGSVACNVLDLKSAVILCRKHISQKNHCRQSGASQNFQNAISFFHTAPLLTDPFCLLIAE